MNANARLITAIFTKPLASPRGFPAGDKGRLRRALGTNKLPEEHPPPSHAQKMTGKVKGQLGSEEERRDGRGFGVFRSSCEGTGGLRGLQARARVVARRPSSISP